jgi:hypothetical protein
MIRRLAFVGPSGSGKTTAAQYAAEVLSGHDFKVERLDVALPLREIQEFAYKRMSSPKLPRLCGDPTKSETFLQDGKLLGFLAHHFEDWLTIPFKSRLKQLPTSTVIINADCRDNTYLALKGLCFKFIRLDTIQEIRDKRLFTRSDITTETSASLDSTSSIDEDFFIENNGSLSELKFKIYEVLNQLFDI